MRGLSGLALVLAGGMAGLYGLFPEASDRKAALDTVASWWSTSDTVVEVAGQMASVADPARRVFSPQTPLFQQPTTTTAPGTGSTATVRTAAAASPVRTVDSPDTVPLAIVTKVLPLAAAAEAPPSQAASARSKDDDAKRELTRSLQKELKRVGCYDGEISGDWSTASKRAMKSFTDRVNASLPVEAPDYILLTLVQGHAATACGSCPADQSQASDGRCVPRSILAQSGKKSGKAAEKKPIAKVQKPVETAERSVEKAVTPRIAAARPEAKPGTGGDVDRAVEMWSKVSPGTTKAAGDAGNAGWQARTVTAAAAPEPAPQAAASPQVSAVVTPLPGRMSIGGPVPSPTQVTPTAAAKMRATVAAKPDAGRVDEPAPVQQANPTAGNGNGTGAAGKAEKPRIPRSAVDYDRPKPARVKPTYNARPVYVDKPIVTSKASRVRKMHYDLFQNPLRTTN